MATKIKVKKTSTKYEFVGMFSRIAKRIFAITALSVLIWIFVAIAILLALWMFVLDGQTNNNEGITSPFANSQQNKSL